MVKNGTGTCLKISFLPNNPPSPFFACQGVQIFEQACRLSFAKMSNSKPCHFALGVVAVKYIHIARFAVGDGHRRSNANVH